MQDTTKSMQTGADGAGGAIKQVLLSLLSGQSASPELRDAIAGNLTLVGTALQGLQPYVSQFATEGVTLTGIVMM